MSSVSNRLIIRALLLTAIFIIATAAIIRFFDSTAGEPTDDHGMTALMRAAHAGDLAEVKQLISRGAGVNTQVPSNDLEVIVAFISWMQPVKHREVGWTPLMFAARGGHVEIARALLDAGADVNRNGRSAASALHVAVENGHYDMAALLLEAGAAPYHAILYSAAVRGDADTAQLLVDYGVPADAPVDPEGAAVVRSADNRGARELDGGSPLLVAAMRGHARVVRVLLNAGADINVRDPRAHWTPLQWATHHNHIAVADMLRRAGAADDGAQNSVLIRAVQLQDAAGVRAALLDGARPNANDERGEPALLLAAQRGNLEIVQALIEAGANVNVSHRYGKTPLYAAASKGNIEMLRALIAAGAQVNAPKETALVVAANTGNEEAVDVLLAAGAAVNVSSGEALRLAAWRGRTNIMDKLLRAGADPNLKDASGMTALRRACGLGHSEAARILLQHGANPNQMDDSGTTALMSAAVHGCLDCVYGLLEHSANVHARDRDGHTALHFAHRYKHDDVAQALRDAGAKE